MCCLILSFANWFSGTILYLSESQKEETKDTQSDIWENPRPMKTIALLKTSKVSLTDYEVLKLQDLVKIAGKVLLPLYSKKIYKDEIISQCRSDDRQKKQSFSEGCSLYLTCEAGTMNRSFLPWMWISDEAVFPEKQRGCNDGSKVEDWPWEKEQRFEFACVNYVLEYKCLERVVVRILSFKKDERK